jgi:hypothetical protein
LQVTINVQILTQRETLDVSGDAFYVESSLCTARRKNDMLMVEVERI